MNKSKALLHFSLLMFGLAWLILEDDFRNLIFNNKQNTLFIVETIPIAVYTFVAVTLIVLVDIFSINRKNLKNSGIGTKTIIVLSIISFLLPLMFIQVRTEVTDSNLIEYTYMGNVRKIYNIEDADYVQCNLDYSGPKDVPFNGVHFYYEICFGDTIIKIYSNSSDKYWDNIKKLDLKARKFNIKREIVGYEYIDTVKDFNNVNRVCNYPFGVFSHIDEIESIMNYSQHK